MLACVPLLVPATVRADVSFSPPGLQSDLSARGDQIVYLTGSTPGIGRLRLGVETPADLPGIPGGDYRGLDLGTDSRGRAVLVYSRCRRDACNVFSYRFDQRRERPVPGASRRACDETLPRVERGVVTFARQLHGAGRRGCGRGLYLKRPGRRARRLLVLGAGVDYDYSNGVLAYTESRDLPGGLSREEIRLRRTGRRHSELVARETLDPGATTPTGGTVGDPQLDAGFVYWSRATLGFDFRRANIRRRRVRGGAVTTLDRAERLWTDPLRDTLLTFVVAGDRLYYAYGFVGPAAWPGSIGLVDPPPVFR